jgi:hypothetical protein
MRPVAPAATKPWGGVLRVRAVLSVLAAAWCWGWSFGVIRVPLGLAVVVGAWSAGVGERSIGPDASVLSVWLGRVGVVGGGVFAVFGSWLVWVAWDRSGWVGLINALLTT